MTIMASHHIVSAYDDELKFLTRKIAAMGGHAERMVDQSVTAIIHGDLALARKIVEDDQFLDETQRAIDERTISIIARRQPLASDLREVIGAIRIAGDLERVGDLGKNIAKRAIAIRGGMDPASPFRGLRALADLALTQLKEVLDVYASRDVARLPETRDRDEQIDSMFTSVFRELLTYMMEDPRNIAPCTHLLFCAKNIERIGDHATNVAEAIYYIVTGEQLPADRPKVDEASEIAALPRGQG